MYDTIFTLKLLPCRNTITKKVTKPPWTHPYEYKTYYNRFHDQVIWPYFLMSVAVCNTIQDKIVARPPWTHMYMFNMHQNQGHPGLVIYKTLFPHVCYCVRLYEIR